MDALDTAFKSIPRHLFIPGISPEHAGQDRPFSIGYGQTNSQPSTVRRMLEWLDVKPGHSVLDVGSGSGWSSALLAHLVGDTGHVTAVELVPQLVERSRMACERLGLHRVVVHQANASLGWAAAGPYDRILVSASADRMPDELLLQLKSPGKMVVPMGNTIYEVAKDDHGKVSLHAHTGYIFVPLIIGQ